MDLTVGKIEEELRKYPKGTAVNLSCGCCHHGSVGNETILNINDETNQTYGYIELELNATSEPNVDLAVDKENFFLIEINKLKGIIAEKDKEIKGYEYFIQHIQGQIDFIKKKIFY